MRRSVVLLGVAAIALVPMELLAQSAIKITSPTSDLVVRPGQTLGVDVSVSGPYSLVYLSGPSTTITVPHQSLDTRPYLFHVTVPERSAPGRYMITASLYTPSRVSIASDTIWIDVERPDSPRNIRIGAGSTNFQVGLGTELKVVGTFEGGTEIDLSHSTRTTYAPDSTGVVSVSKEGQVTALAPGAATILVHHQNLQGAVNVSVANANLQITSPAEGTVVHAGETLLVDVTASGGPFEFVSVSASDLRGGEMLKSAPYRFSLQVPMPKKPGPTNITAIGKTGSLTMFSLPVSVDIERLDAPEAIFIDRSVIGTERLSVGQQGRIYVYGKLSDNPLVNLTESSLTTYEPDTKGVVSVTKDGYTTGLAAGATNIVVRYRNLETVVRVVVAGNR
jgi:Bacterial Ig-like domain (group 2)